MCLEMRQCAASQIRHMHEFHASTQCILIRAVFIGVDEYSVRSNGIALIDNPIDYEFMF